MTSIDHHELRLDEVEPGTPTEHRFMDAMFDELFPICRSITGPGLRQSLNIFGRYLPLQFGSVASGTQVFDWVVPQEWHIRAARLTGSDGTVYADFKCNNLHVVNYSESVDQEFDLAGIRPHLYSIKNLPDAIPYVFSYYQRCWGFCLPHRVIDGLSEGRYHAYIDSEFIDGQLDFAHAILPGETGREVLLSSYLCHPSLANNELSGPLVLLALYNRIKRWPRQRYTYRFVLNPETIGSLCYLYRYGDALRDRLAAGLVLTCLGGPSERLSYKQSRRGDSLLDQTVNARVERGETKFEIRPFTPANGSDERQYCSPGFNLPVGQMASTVYGTYDGYHNSLDTKEFMGIRRLLENADKIACLLWEFEHAGNFINLAPYGEPQLGRRGLYPAVSWSGTWGADGDTASSASTFRRQMLYVLNYADGEHTMLSVADKCGCRVLDLVPVIERLEQVGLLRMAAAGRPVT